jgi:hypothetical protein
MRLDFLDFRSQWELLQLVENDIEVGTWRLLHRLVANHVKLILQIAMRTVQGIRIPVSPAGSFFILTVLMIGVLR